jgi:predicted ATPase/DNA-binding SARP family transcriptional activator
MLEVRLLGTFEVKYKRKPVSISSRPAQSLFAYLVLSAGTSHRREKLAGMLWPDSLEETARDNLRHALWRIRKALPSQPKVEYLLAGDLSIAFNASAEYWLDATELEKLSKTASADELIAVLSTYQGELLPGFYDEWVVLEREHLQSVFEHKMARLMSLLQDEKRWLDILDWGERWIKLGQKPEPAYRALMSAHAAKGDMSKVAATYERCVKSLKEFGIEPSDKTRALYARLKTGKETLEIGSTVAVMERRKVSLKTNLPIPLTSFIGREKEVEEIIKLLGKNRLITLIGSGGVGKTRLAIQSANRLISKFKDGVWWVDLVSLADPARVPQAVAQVVDVPAIPNQPLIRTLAEYFRSKQVLLILDNCEHLISACAQLADQLLSTCEKLKILATSREGLDILGETIWPVPSLSLPEMQEAYAIKSLNKFESIRLFIERALSVHPKFELTDQNAQAVVQTCRRLGGMPLAIELAAARVKMMSVDEIAKRLDDRFDLLTAGSRTALRRHQTLRATIDWSFDLLSETERILFRRLSVFASGFTLHAAEAVAAGEDIVQSQVIELLGNLINKSLVRVEERSGDAEVETRYGMLETIREYARERLREAGEEDLLRSRHLEFFLNMVEEVGPKLEGPEQKLLLDRLETEIDNLRAGMDWALENKEIITALRFAGAFPRFWFIRAHHNEGVERLRTILDRPDAMQPTPARLKALNAYLFMLWPSGQLAEIKPRGEEALALGIQLGDRWNSGFALLWLGVGATVQGDFPLARSYLEQSLEIWRELEEKTYAAWSYVFRGEVALLQGDTLDAQELYLQSLPLLRKAQDYPFLAIPLRRLGQLAMSQGDLPKATAFIKESLQHNWKVHDYRGTGASLAALAALSLAQGETERAIKLLGAADALLEFIRTPFLAFDQQQYEDNVGQLRDQIDRPTFMKAWTEGRAMPLEEAVEFALR